MSDRSHEYDVAIIGGGPAGAGAAYYLARRGFDVAVLEAKSYPRPKSCGDGIGPRAVMALREMGLEDWLKSSGAFRLDRLRIIASSGTSITSIADEKLFPIVYGYVMQRTVFDHKLIEHARAHGAQVLEDWRAEALIEDKTRYTGIKGTHNGKPAAVRAKLIVVADGSKGKISRLFGPQLSRAQAVGYRTYAKEITGIDSCCNIYFTREFPKGYTWVFPTGPTTANIGVGMLGMNNGTRGTSVHAAYNYMLDEQNLAPISLKGSVIEKNPIGSVMRMNYGTRPLWRPSLAFAGDAAGLVSPINGEGISHAIESGKMLAESLPDRLVDNRTIDKALLDYEKAMNAQFRTFFRWGRLFSRVFATPDHLDRAIAKANKHEELRVILGAVIANTVHPRELTRLKMLRQLVF